MYGDEKSRKRQLLEIFEDMKVDLNQLDSHRETILYRAVRSCDVSYVELLLSIKSIDKTIKNNTGQTPLDIAQEGLKKNDDRQQKFKEIVHMFEK